jgi:hypothetical protein
LAGEIPESGNLRDFRALRGEMNIPATRQISEFYNQNFLKLGAFAPLREKFLNRL